MLNHGWDAWAIDAVTKNPHCPKERSVIAYAQNLPFASESFDLTVSYWLIPHFFRTGGYSMLNPPAGRKALLEMIRVTRIGGELRIGPMLPRDSQEGIEAFLNSLQKKGLIRYEIITPTEFPQTDALLVEYMRNNRCSMSSYYHYAKVFRLK
jgi:ubiquinone/menaquinone biosynthesis C-methylase UbiE